MEEVRSIFTIILLKGLGIDILVLGVLYWGYRSSKKNNERKWRILMIAFVILLCMSFSNNLGILREYIEFNPQKSIVKVVDINVRKYRKTIRKDPVVDDGNKYDFFYLDLEIEKGAIYELIYTPESKIVLKATKVE